MKVVQPKAGFRCHGEYVRVFGKKDFGKLAVVVGMVEMWGTVVVFYWVDKLQESSGIIWHFCDDCLACVCIIAEWQHLFCLIVSQEWDSARLKNIVKMYFVYRIGFVCVLSFTFNLDRHKQHGL